MQYLKKYAAVARGLTRRKWSLWFANDLVALSGTKDNFSGGREKKYI